MAATDEPRRRLRRAARLVRDAQRELAQIGELAVGDVLAELELDRAMLEAVELEAIAVAEAHVAACHEALELEDPPELDTAGPFCGCDTCVVRETLHAAWPVLTRIGDLFALCAEHGPIRLTITRAGRSPASPHGADELGAKEDPAWQQQQSPPGEASTPTSDRSLARARS